jgi:hypothetical protein
MGVRAQFALHIFSAAQVRFEVKSVVFGSLAHVRFHPEGDAIASTTNNAKYQ